MSLPRTEPRIELPRVTHAASERHSDLGDIIRDITIGFADGLTVPFALTAGLSSLGSSKIVIVGGLAELFSGAISMGLGAYLAAVTDRDHYSSEEAREREEVLTKPGAEQEECLEILDGYGISREASQSVVDCLTRDPEQWIRFMMDFELKLEKPNVSRAWISAATMGLSYFIGGLLPMIPYFAMKNTTHALFISIGITIVVCILFGFLKNFAIIKTKRAGFYGAAQTLIVGAIAAGTSYGIVYGVDHSNIGN
ncbi:Vacuolar iron transporter 1 [Penicillium diatomitis]|uniref:Vacuolar iron transporter 1 n=1 Tax=Penicillium diatomitis TaxID=2819901 RepID=A0A9W9XDH7_9EURO|nr:Vacuolar iron transporter 1 [Penicillium diatomitis]KAJ5489375.1 Vacuolar iron transporter 1 [Penicillium diatomitis]